MPRDVNVLVFFFFFSLQINIQKVAEMSFHRSDQSRQYSERRHRDPDDEHWGKCESQRIYHSKYGGSMEKTSRSREFSASPRRQYSKEEEERRRNSTFKSTLTRDVSSSDWAASEKKKRRLTEDEDHYKYRHLAEVKTSRQLSLGSTYIHTSTDFKHEDDFESRKRTRSFRHGHHHEEFVHRKRYEDDNESTWGCSRVKTETQDDSMKVSGIRQWKAFSVLLI